MIDLNLLQAHIHRDAKEKGWWDEEVDKDPIKKLALVVAEVVEAIEEYRSGHEMNEVYYDGTKPEGVPVEMADAVIRLLDLAGYHGIDLESVIAEKLEYNRTRPYRHGGKRF